ncbi:hypothetical protein AKJ64_02640 [candidate division MSBL1 archaeon SCGC-AAA259E17]|uniref:Tetratricopeptide repeat protein n=1 Tax=candidate division MSBL1 archaeon SCGC-AAA259E17 TaxID=1698263 RepID=A0A133UEP3_9EURY|nr:hypothetical protein AKJ64_02640 [candidate division MSBL1 archaeon SCGC-AAA259E17]
MAADRQIGTDREIIGLCKKLLAESDNNEVALSVKKEAEQRLEEKRRRNLSELEEEGLESYGAGNYRKAVKSFSDVPADFLSPGSVKAMAESQKALGRHEKALEWYEELPETIENVSARANCALEMGEYEEASDHCENLLGMRSRRGSMVGWLASRTSRTFTWATGSTASTSARKTCGPRSRTP